MNSFAIVIGKGTYNDLGLIRSLGEAKIPVIYITNKDYIVPIHKSKYIKKTIFCTLDEKTIIKKLKEISESINTKLTVFPSTDKSALILDQHYEELAKHNIIVQNAKGKINTLMDKALMNNLAEDVGFIVPNSCSLFSDEYKNIDNIESFCFPCIVKPLQSVLGNKSDISICKDKHELKLCINRYFAHNISRALIQDYISGDNVEDVCIPGVSLINGEIVITGQIKKIRLRGKSVCYGVFEPFDNEVIKQQIVKFIKKTGFIGIFDIDLLKKGEDFYFIECNFRNGAYGYATTKGGINLPAAFHQSVTKKSFSINRQCKRTIFMDERSDIHNFLDKEISLCRWFKDVVTADCLLYWNWKDPKPMIRLPYFVKRFLRFK